MTPIDLAFVALLGTTMLYCLGLIVVALKAPPRKGGMKWRSMTSSTLFDSPAIKLMIIVSLAVLVTMFTTGRLTTSGAP